MPVPQKYVEDGLKLADGMRVFDTAVSEMTREELIACLALAAAGLRLRDERDRDRDTSVVSAFRRMCAGP